MNLTELLHSLPGSERRRSRSRSKSRERGRPSSKVEESTLDAFKPSTGTSPSRPLSFAAVRSNDTIISITPVSVPASEADETGDPAETICVEVQCDTVSHKETVRFSNGSAQEQIEELNDLHYAAEDYSREDPRIRGRVCTAFQGVRTNTHGLIEQLGLDNVLGALILKMSSLSKTIYIDIEDDLADPYDSIHNIHWESLENPKLWPEDSNFTLDRSKTLGLELCVRRGGAKGRLALANRYRGRANSSARPKSAGAFPAFNILLVAARDLSLKTDENMQSATATSLFAAMKNLPEQFHINLEVCRPGSWDAMKRHISSKPKGFFQFVHLDVPVKNDNILCFSSASMFNNLEGIPSSMVAKFLESHEVPAVFLHCHNLNITPRVNQKKLLVEFVQERLTVVSCQYHLIRAYMFKFIDNFYQSLFVNHKKGVAFAAHVARRDLYMSAYTRTARYSMDVPITTEYLGILAYDNAKIDEIDLSAFVYDNVAGVPARFGNEWCEIVFPGRDLDIMRLEKWALQKSNIIWMTGQRHIGKTELCKYLVWWWRCTRFVETNCFAQLSTSQASFRMLLVDTVNFFIGRNEIKTFSGKNLVDFVESPKPTRSQKVYKELVKLLRERRIYLFFDDVGQWKPFTPFRTDANAMVWQQERQGLLDFFDDIRGGQSVIIAVCPFNDRSIAAKDEVYVLDRVDDMLIQSFMYPIDWSSVLPGLTHFDNRNVAQQALENDFCDFHDAIVQLNEGIPGVQDFFIYNRPFSSEQRTRDIHILLNSSTPGTTGPYTMESPAVVLMTTVYNLVMLDRADIEDKDPTANPNICRLIYALCVFQGWVPVDLDMYLVFLSYYGLFTEEWLLPFPSVHNHSADEWVSRDAEFWSTAVAALRNSTLKANFDLVFKSLIEADYLMKMPDIANYYKINPSLTMALRKIVFANDGPLTEPVLPLAIRPAADEFYIHRFQTVSYAGPDNKNLMLEKSTFITIMWSVIAKGNNYRAIHLAAYAPIEEYMAQDLSPTDQRLLVTVTSSILNWFSILLDQNTNHDPAVSHEVFFQYWVRAYTAAHYAMLFHGQCGLEPIAYHSYVKLMRKFEDFGRLEYTDEKRQEANMNRFLPDLAVGERNVQDMFDTGFLVREGQQADAEQGEELPPPAYEPPQETRVNYDAGIPTEGRPVGNASPQVRSPIEGESVAENAEYADQPPAFDSGDHAPQAGTTVHGQA